MENRFGIKDLFNFLLLGGIIVLVVLCLKQYDRQWDQIQELKGRVGDLTNDLTTIRNTISQGINVQTTSQAPTTSTADPFAAIREAKAKPDWATGDWLVENFGTSIGKLTPYIDTDIYATWVQNKTMEQLAYRDPDTLKYVPQLATSWEISDDGKTIAVNLRRGVVFSDGIPLTAKDVVFTFNWVMNPQVNAARVRAYIDHMESVTAEGDYRVVFKFKTFIFNTFSSVVEMYILPEHFYSKFTASEFNEKPGLLMGSGPYRLATPDQWRPGVRVELVRNERYWGMASAFDRLVFHEVKDEVAEETMFRNREVDRFAPTPEQFEKLKNDPAITSRATTWEYYSPVSGYNFVGWNQKRGGKDPTVFADKRVRNAMTMLIDRDRMAREMWFGHAQPATGPFGYGSPQTDPAIKALPYDPVAAKKLLAEAGFTDQNGDGVLERDGKPFEVTLSYGSGNPFTDRIVLFLKDSLAQAGVKLNLDAVDWPIFLKKLDTRDYDACILGWSTSIETDCNQIFHSSQIKDQGDNFICYANPDLDAAIDKARATVDENERMLAWRAVHRIIHEDQPYTFLLSRQSIGFIDSRIHNIHKTKLGLNMVLQEMTPFPWYVPKAEQLHKTVN